MPILVPFLLIDTTSDPVVGAVEQDIYAVFIVINAGGVHRLNPVCVKTGPTILYVLGNKTVAPPPPPILLDADVIRPCESTVIFAFVYVPAVTVVFANAIVISVDPLYDVPDNPVPIVSVRRF